MTFVSGRESWQIFNETRQLIEQGKFFEARSALKGWEGRSFLSLPPEEEAEAALLWAWVLYRENAYSEAIAKARSAFSGYRLTSNHSGAAESLYLLGLLNALTGDLRQAERFLLDALAGYRRASDSCGVARTYSELARLAFIRSDLKQAEEHLLESLEAARSAADSQGEGRAWGNLGRVYFIGGRWEEAERALRLALLVNQITGSAASLARNHLSLAYFYLHSGRFPEAEKELELAEAKIFSEKLAREEAILHEYRGELFFWRKEWIQAEDEYRLALELGQRLAPQSGLVTQVERRWAELLLVLGRPGLAFSRAENALNLARLLGEKEEILASLRVMAASLLETGELEKAADIVRQAVELSGGVPLEELRLKFTAAAVFSSADEGRAFQLVEEIKNSVGLFKGSPVLTHELLGAAERTIALGRFSLAGRVLEVIEEGLKKEILFAPAETRSRMESLFEKTYQGKLAAAFSGKNRYALFAHWGKSGSLEEKLLALSTKLGAEGAWIANFAEGKPVFLAKAGNITGLEYELAERPMGMRSVDGRNFSLSFPLEIEGEKLGVLGFARSGKPFGQEELDMAAAATTLVALELSHLAKKNLARENERLLASLKQTCSFPNIITQSSQFMAILDAAAQVKDSDLSILLMGETGAGKDLLAKTIHFQSVRRAFRFVSVNCAALPETLLESELFGHRRGAFTGADRDKPGLFEEADEGTFFLDEVTEIPLSVQAKLLRVLEEKEVVRLGETRPRKVNVRLISAGNRDLKALTERGQFRQDLYYRLSAFTLRLPSLRERKEDIPLLLEHFAVKYAGRGKLRFAPGALELLTRYDWPGNVRELENEIRKLTVTAGESGQVPVELLSSKFFGIEGKTGSNGQNGHFSLYDFLAESEKQHILRALAKTGWVKKRAAEFLKIPESSLRLKLKEYGITPPTAP